MGEVDPKLGELIKKTRIERKLTQEQTAELVSISPPMITYTPIKTAAFLFINL